MGENGKKYKCKAFFLFVLYFEGIDFIDLYMSLISMILENNTPFSL